MIEQPTTPPFDAAAAAVTTKYDELLHTVAPKEAVLASYTPDTAFHFLSDSRPSGSYFGYDGIIEFHNRLDALVDLPSSEFELLLPGDGWVTEIRRAVMVRNGEECVFDEVVNYRIVNDRIAELWLAPADPAGVDAFLS